MRRRLVAVLLASVSALSGCAEFTCTPTTIEVASKDTRTRMVDQFRGVNSDPMLMGRSAGAYDALRIYPATIVEVMEDMKKNGR